MDDSAIYRGRAAVLADLTARRLASAEVVSLLDEICSERRWWLEQWAEGAAFVPGLIAQDVQERMADEFGRTDPAGLWPLCQHCSDGPVHTLHIDPDLGGPDPVWVCEESGTTVAPLGSLGSPTT
ncbi:hypothetical protein FXB39_20440 [Nocardioides sp. BGMRC 2183]|nr:hypothetical protein FXB39_20440 [Nocardioides sp. BGMRC 2183]